MSRPESRKRRVDDRCVTAIKEEGQKSEMLAMARYGVGPMEKLSWHRSIYYFHLKSLMAGFQTELIIL